MAFIKFVQWALFLCFLSSISLTSATSCEYNGDCYPPQTCCSDHVCREECNYCSYDSQCGSRECCGNDGKCKTRCSDSIYECPDGVSCREMGDHCSKDYQCGTGVHECPHNELSQEKCTNSVSWQEPYAGFSAGPLLLVDLFCPCTSCFRTGLF